VKIVGYKVCTFGPHLANCEECGDYMHCTGASSHLCPVCRGRLPEPVYIGSREYKPDPEREQSYMRRSRSS
jgi:hypothetical protein